MSEITQGVDLGLACHQPYRSALLSSREKENTFSLSTLPGWKREEVD